MSAKQACDRWSNGCLATLARCSAGRIALHLLAMAGDRCIRFHLAGILRELAIINGCIARWRATLSAALARYLSEPIDETTPTIDAQALATLLHCGDVLLTASNTRIASLVQRLTRSPWSHVALYVGPLEHGPDPRCIVEADIAAGVRSIRLSELNALQLRVLRPTGLDDAERRRLATWTVERIGCPYDVAQAFGLARRLLRLSMRTSRRSMPEKVAQGARRFICCSLLAHAFALVGCSIAGDTTRRESGSAANAQRFLTPADFEHAPLFEAIEPAQTYRSTPSCNSRVAARLL